jgi:hypothetical protein
MYVALLQATVFLANLNKYSHCPLLLLLPHSTQNWLCALLQLWAMTTIEQQVPAGELQQLLDAFVAKLQQANPRELSNALLACASPKKCPISCTAVAPLLYCSVWPPGSVS